MLKISKTFSYRGTALELTDAKRQEFIMDSNQMAAKGLRGLLTSFLVSIRKFLLVFQCLPWLAVHRSMI